MSKPEVLVPRCGDRPLAGRWAGGRMRPEVLAPRCGDRRPRTMSKGGRKSGASLR